ncbi:hypothetical protein FA13DRAFT_1792888 [Coprinellus micaceus]|uniref:Uncharacterized protein n=1 Tax=Coprinellus micaceus TaxID=71717 RepID=A0A4Y7T7R8_COPMI|nr:hypothetical protein FA13DRAFT_1792888 [Coprinellus micaceus]
MSTAAFNCGYNYSFLPSPPYVVCEVITHIADDVADLCHILRREDTPVEPEAWVEQTSDPETAWQAQMLFDQKPWSSIEDSRKRGALWHATWQENAVWTVADLAGQYPTPKQQYFNHILKRNPDVIDILLHVQYTGATTLAPILSAEMVPGAKVKVDHQRIQAKLEARWRGLMVGFKELTSCSGWCQRLIDVWVHLENEDIAGAEL